MGKNGEKWGGGGNFVKIMENNRIYSTFGGVGGFFL